MPGASRKAAGAAAPRRAPLTKRAPEGVGTAGAHFGARGMLKPKLHPSTHHERSVPVSHVEDDRAISTRRLINPTKDSRPTLIWGPTAKNGRAIVKGVSLFKIPRACDSYLA
jgi:hypothetical protein